jgi:type IV pilus assembly protein PilA
MSTQWYYADRNQQQQGPVEAEWLQGAFARGEVNAASLLWHEGMPAWLPLSQVAGQLGIALQSSAPAAPGPRRPNVVAPARRGMPVFVIVLIVLGAMVPVLGILAAIAIPAYHDYSTRAHVMQALAQGNALKLNVEEFVLENDRCPVNGEAGILQASAYAQPAPSKLRAIEVGPLDDGSERCAIAVQLEGDGYEADSITLIRRDTSDWGYRSTLRDAALPASMRNQPQEP